MYNLVYSAIQSDPYPSFRQLEVPSTTVTLEGNLEQFNVPNGLGLPFADYSVQIFAYNVKRGESVRNGVVMATEKTIAIGEWINSLIMVCSNNPSHLSAHTT